MISPVAAASAVQLLMSRCLSNGKRCNTFYGCAHGVGQATHPVIKGQKIAADATRVGTAAEATLAGTSIKQFPQGFQFPDCPP